MEGLLEPIHQRAERARLAEWLRAGHTGYVGGLWGGVCACLTAALFPRAPGHLLLIVPAMEAAHDEQENLRLFSETAPLLFPAWESLPTEDEPPNQEILSQRLGVLQALHDQPDQPQLIVASIAALLQPVPSPTSLEAGIRRLRTGDRVALEAVAEWLVDRGYERMPMVEVPGEFAIRGGILDVYPVSGDHPVRLELEADRIDSIRTFDPATQRSLGPQSACRLTAITALQVTSPRASTATSLLPYLGPDSWVFFLEPVEVQNQAEKYLATFGHPKSLFSFEDFFVATAKLPRLMMSGLPAPSGERRVDLPTDPTDHFAGDLASIAEEFNRLRARHDRLILFCSNQGEEQRFRELLEEQIQGPGAQVEYRTGFLAKGFQLREERIAVVPHHEVFHRYQLRRRARPRRLTRPIDSFAELGPGQLVVHGAHGIAVYRGLERVKKHGEVQEFLMLEFAGKAKLYVPVSKIDLVQRYVGSYAARPSLSRLGGTRWAASKQAAKEATRDLAQELLQIQAVRRSQPGVAFPPDAAWQQEFEAAFPYRETEDQLRAAAGIKADLESPRPMDRLLCGDVGYGKTEVAMRCAFKVVLAGKQVAVLVPTTILAQQHYQTFRERMADYPVVIEVLSRFRSKKDQKEVVERAKVGRVDILIGTHRLLSADVDFTDLGLVIIDEEQRFGVEHKERLKKLRATVDVLTMTATPIPRTLHMALVGLRDISSLETPPQDRLAIHSEVTVADPKRVREAILRELGRDGQVYFVHNRVHNIEQVAEDLRQLVPEARLTIGHGQMRGEELEKHMTEFVRGGCDVLVSTNIIESGLDIPNVNTIFVNDANMFGLADLHQLRGRVGRYHHRAYAYFLIRRDRPITQKALRRLKAIEEFSELGSGFRLALRDLEIRGAGNILGAEQHGHISAVGYDLYCRLLEQTIKELKSEPVEETVELDVELNLDAYLPEGYAPDPQLRVELYRKFGRLRSNDDFAALRDELVDRLGKVPPQAENLFHRHRLRQALDGSSVTYLSRRPGYLLIRFQDAAKVQRALRTFQSQIRIQDDHTLHLHLPEEHRRPLDAVKYLLKDLAATT